MLFDLSNVVVTDSKEPEIAQVSIVNNPSINTGLFNQLVETQEINSIPDDQLYNLLKYNLTGILDSIFNTKDAKYLQVFATSKFLNCLIRVLRSFPSIDYQIMKRCNKLSYDYMTLGDSDKEVRQLFFYVSKIVNQHYIPLLLGTGLSEDLSAYIALARLSNDNELTNVKRMNFVIMQSDPLIMTEDRIFNIYKSLFDRVTPLFEGTMFDVIDLDEPWVTESMSEMYSVISLAVLDILNTLTTEQIVKVLCSYTEDYYMIYSNQPVRFGMNSLSADYQRIVNAIPLANEAMRKKEEYFYVP